MAQSLPSKTLHDISDHPHDMRSDVVKKDDWDSPALIPSVAMSVAHVPNAAFASSKWPFALLVAARSEPFYDLFIKHG